MSEKIYVVGHKSPDLDSVTAAITLAAYLNAAEGTDAYVPAIAGEANKETKYLLEKLGIAMPEKMENAAGKSLVLVDHNEAMQSPDGIAEAKILAIYDHHKLDFKYAEPIKVDIRPWGASASLVTDLFIKAGIEIDAKLAKLLLAAILVDTVITKSPTCTDKDKELIAYLSDKSGESDWNAFGMEIFKVRSDISELSDEAIIRSDYKDFAMKSGKFGIGQVETADLSAFAAREEGLLKRLAEMKEEGGYHSVILFLTDIINVGSRFLIVSSDMAKVEEALGTKIEDGRAYVDGIISRKKQVAPLFSKQFDV